MDQYRNGFDHDPTEFIAANAEVINEEEIAYGNRVGFPTDRRPVQYLRDVYQGQLDEPQVEQWMDAVGHLMIGNYPMSDAEMNRVKLLLYTWRDLFNSDPETMPVTDLVVHTIPTYNNARPY